MARQVRRIVATTLAILLSGALQAAGAFAAEVDVEYGLDVNVSSQFTEITLKQGDVKAIKLFVSATQNLDESYTQADPAVALVDTRFAIDAAGTMSTGNPVSCDFWAVGGDSHSKLVRWASYPAPYVRDAVISVDPKTPAGRYVFSAYMAFDQGKAAPKLDNATTDTVVVNVVAADQDAPVTTAVLAGDEGENGWFLGDVSVSLSAGDNGGVGVESTAYSTDGGASWLPYSAPFTVTAEGVSAVKFYSVDKSGNTESQKSVGVQIDRQAPQVGVSGAADGSRARSFTIEWSASDPTPGSGIAASSAKLDGADFASGTTVESEGEHTLVVSSKDVAGRTSSESLSFVVDRTAPQVDITSPIDGEFYKSDVVFGYSVSDADPIVSVDDDPDLGFVWTGEGAHTANVSATDSAGNTGTDSASFVLDKTAPSVTDVMVGVSGQNEWYTSPVSVSLNPVDEPGTPGLVASGVKETRVRVDGGVWKTYTEAFEVGEGVHSLDYYAIDNAGNESDVVSKQINVDTTKPTAAIAVSGQIRNGWYVIANPFASASGADDGSSIASVEYAIDDPTAWGIWSAPVQIPAGTHTFYARAVDVAGNVSETVSEKIDVDLSAPETSIEVTGETGENGWLTSAATVTIAASDSESGVGSIEYSLDNGGSWNAYTGPFAYDVEGASSIGYRAADRAGNEAAEKSVDVKIDTRVPTIQLLGATDGQWMHDASVGFAADDERPGSGLDFTEVLLDGVPISGLTPVVSEGRHTLSGSVKDAAGNTAIAEQIEFWVDATAPVITISNPADGGVYADAQEFLFSVADSVDPLPTAVSDPAVPFTFEAEGRHTAKVWAHDRVGNSSENSVSFLIDRTAPESKASLSGTAGLADWWRSAVQVTLSAEDKTTADEAAGIEAIYLSVDGAAAEKYSAPFSLSDGEHVVSYYAVDKAGNAEGSHELTVKVDTQAPTVTFSSPTDGGVYGYGNSLALGWSVSDSVSGVSSEAALLNGVAVSKAQTVKLTTAGDNQLFVRASDAAGNVAEATAHFSVRFGFGNWLTPTALEKEWNAGRTLPVKFLVLDGAGKTTNAATPKITASLNGQVFDAGVAYVQYDSAGKPFYQYNLKTLKGKTGTLKLSVDLNDGSSQVIREIVLR